MSRESRQNVLPVRLTVPYIVKISLKMHKLPVTEDLLRHERQLPPERREHFSRLPDGILILK